MYFEFITNTDCSWDCEYCSFGKVQDIQMKKETIKKHSYIFDIMKKIREKIEIDVVVEGGEIGLIKDNSLLAELFYNMGQPVIINTNGLFFQMDRSVLYPYIKKVYYHVAPSAKILFKVNPLDVPLEVIYGVVDDDSVALEKFVDYNNHLPIKYAEYEFIKEEPKDDEKYFTARLSCQTLNPFVSIDLSREVLCPCTSRGCHVTIPLTEENLIKVLKGYNNFDKANEMCLTCYRLSTSFDNMEILKRKMQIGKLL